MKERAQLAEDQFDIPFFVVRTPLLPIAALESVLSQLQGISDAESYKLIPGLFRDSLFQEALYLASPVLHAELNKAHLLGESNYKEAKRLAISFLKYYIRMCSRCTPFGLFATCGIGHLADKSDIDPGEATQIRRSLRLDMDYLCSLGKSLAEKPELNKYLRYYPNSSLYRVRNRLRYVEYRYGTRSVRSHHLVNIDFNFYIKQILRKSRSGLTHGELVDLLVRFDVEEDEASAFVDELIRSQVLQSSLEPNVTGREYFDVLLDFVSRLPSSEYVDRIKELFYDIRDTIGFIVSGKGTVASYRKIHESVISFGVSVDESKLFQVDAVRSGRSNILDRRITDEVAEALSVLTVLNRSSRPPRTQLEIFMNAFVEKYETRAVKLVEALDSEIGLGYRKAKSIADHYYNRPVSEGMLDQLRLRKFQESVVDEQFQVEITVEDVKAFGDISKPVLEDSFCAMLTLLTQDTDKSGPHFELKGMSPSIGILLGRFCHADGVIEKELVKALEMEDANHGDVIFAEVAHLPQSRVGNVLARPHLRKYEIPYLAQSTLSEEAKIQLDDLYIKVENNRVVLLSKKLKKEVIPRLSSAHNFPFKSLSIYHFLCDMQYQGRNMVFDWNWGRHGAAAFLPRVIYKNAVLSAARWNLNLRDVEEIVGCKSKDFKKDWLEKIKSRLKLTDRFYLVEGDNLLLLDSTVEYCANLLCDKVKKGAVMLKEYLGAGDMAYANELIIPFIRKSHLLNGSMAKATSPTYFASSIQRDFYPGSEWLYFKVYGSSSSFDAILEMITRFIDREVMIGSIEKWFFIRYADPKSHLRVRLKLRNPEKSGVLQAFYNAVHTLIVRGTIHNVSLDVYKREIERYGRFTMGLSEQMFSINSTLVCHLLSRLKAGGLSYGQHVNAAAVIDRTMDAFGFDLKAKLTFYEHNLNLFFKEFGFEHNKGLRGMLSDFYRSKKNEVTELLDTGKFGKQPVVSEHVDRYIHMCRELFLRISEKNRIHSKNPVPIESLLGSYHHMFVNRLVDKEPRQAEMMVYYLLHSHFRSIVARAKKGVSVHVSI